MSKSVASTNLIPVYYAYFIGYYGHANGLPDQNLAPSGPNLATGGAALIKANRAKIIQMYASYAQMTHTAWPTKPLVWFLEGDFIQYTASTQSSPLTMAELGQLAADITCAIKTNMPNAVVAINHTTWNADADTNNFWCQMKLADYDLVWTTGVADNTTSGPFQPFAQPLLTFVPSVTGDTVSAARTALAGASLRGDSLTTTTASTLPSPPVSNSNGMSSTTISAPCTSALAKNFARSRPTSGWTMPFSRLSSSGLPSTAWRSASRSTLPAFTTPGNASPTGPTAAPPSS